MAYKYYSVVGQNKEEAVIEMIGENPSSKIKNAARDFLNALRNADASISGFEIVLEGWDGTETVLDELKNQLLDFEGRYIDMKRVDLVLRQIEIKYDFPDDTYSVEALIVLATDLKTVTHKHTVLMAALNKIKLPEQLKEE